jgi:serine/threonine protein phosphatase PrpC
MPVSLHFGARTHRGCVRQSNEDAFIISDLRGDAAVVSTQFGPEPIEVGRRGVLFAVSDGLGGHQAGDVASALVIETLSRELAHERPSRPSIVRIESAVERANRAVLEAARAPHRRGMGATLTAGFVSGKKLYLAEVGDSRGYLLRGGILSQVTRDQSYVQLLLDQRALSPEDVSFFPGRNVVLQAMGQAKVTVAVGAIELRRRDRILLCSDGLTNDVPESVIAGILTRDLSCSEACDALIDVALDCGGHDNVTAVVAEVHGDVAEASSDDGMPDALLELRSFMPKRSA